MNDKKLKDMWKAEYFMDTLGYQSNTIEGFLSKSSGTVAGKIRKMIQLDLVLKAIGFIVLILNSIIYYNVQEPITHICIFGAVLLIPLMIYEYSSLKKFNFIFTSGNNIKDDLSGMLGFLNNRAYGILIAIATTYLFVYTAGMLLYFFAEYGELRRMGTLDIFVFPSICIFGIILNFIYNQKVIKYQIRHLQLCLSNADEEMKPAIASKIETSRKNEQLITILVAVIAFLALFVFIAILKSLGV